MICLRDKRWALEQEKQRLRNRLTEVNAKLLTLGARTGLTYRELIRIGKEAA